MSDGTPLQPTFGRAPRPTHVPAWMTIAEARTVLAAAGQPALPVAGHTELIGLITIEALGGGDGSPPDADAPLVSVMDWHLVQMPPGADEVEVLRRYTDAAWHWLGQRRQELTAPEGSTR